jgi:hypothetical protein
MLLPPMLARERTVSGRRPPPCVHLVTQHGQKLVLRARRGLGLGTRRFGLPGRLGLRREQAGAFELRALRRRASPPRCRRRNRQPT